MSNLLLIFPIQLLDSWKFYPIYCRKHNIILHIHSLVELTTKYNRFLFYFLNYKIKYYNQMINKYNISIKNIQGSKKKRRQQKGTGKSRVGCLKSSMHRGGGFVFSGIKRSIQLKINTKEWISVYKSLILNKRKYILWFYVNKYMSDNVVNLFNNIIRHLGISQYDKISFFIFSKYIDNKKYYIHNISILKFFLAKYLIYLI